MPRKKKPVDPSVVDQKIAGIRTHLTQYLELFRRTQEEHPDAILMGKGMCGYYNLMLEKGTEFRGRVDSKNYPECDNFRKWFKPKTKQCFYNSQMFVLGTSNGEARYFEGYAYNTFLPVLHAWVVMPDNNVVDFTLEAANRYFKRNKLTVEEPSDVAYLGVEVPHEALQRIILKLKTAEPCAHMHHLGASLKERFFLD